MSEEKKDLTGIMDGPGTETAAEPSADTSESGPSHIPEALPMEDAFPETQPVDVAPGSEQPSMEAPEAAQLDKFESLEEIAETAELAAPQTPEQLSEVQAESSPEPLPDIAAEVSTENDPLSAAKILSDNLPVGQSNVPASYPFSLFVTGELTAQEKEKLLDILSRENMGIREVDLEPQFQSNRVLIPRISEYAGIMIVQCLRGARAEIKLGPSDPDSAEESQTSQSTVQSHATLDTQEINHPAETLPLTNDSALPELPRFSVLGVITASAALKTTVVEAERSAEYQEILEALQRELRYKAYRKGAAAIVNFSVTLNRLTLPTGYRLSVMGTAVQTLPDPIA